MEDVYKIETIQRYNNICGFKTMHPLVAYVESSENNSKFIPGTVQEYIAVHLFSYAKRQLSSPIPHYCFSRGSLVIPQDRLFLFLRPWRYYFTPTDAKYSVIVLVMINR